MKYVIFAGLLISCGKAFATRHVLNVDSALAQAKSIESGIVTAHNDTTLFYEMTGANHVLSRTARIKPAACQFTGILKTGAIPPAKTYCTIVIDTAGFVSLLGIDEPDGTATLWSLSDVGYQASYNLISAPACRNYVQVGQKETNYQSSVVTASQDNACVRSACFRFNFKHTGIYSGYFNRSAGGAGFSPAFGGSTHYQVENHRGLAMGESFRYVLGTIFRNTLTIDAYLD